MFCVCKKFRDDQFPCNAVQQEEKTKLACGPQNFYGPLSEREAAVGGELRWEDSRRQIVPCIALVLYGFGQVAVFMGTQTYAVDSYSQYAASAVAAVSCLRSLVGTFMVRRSLPCDMQFLALIVL